MYILNAGAIHFAGGIQIQLNPIGRLAEHVYQVKFFRGRDREALLMALRQDLAAQETRLLLQDSTAEY